jgi:hypothetical protein
MPVACREKNSESRMIAPKSAIEAPAIVSWPKSEEISPASLSSGTLPYEMWG